MEVDSWITITLLVNFIALIFQIGAYTAPLWAWYQSSSVFFGLGLWYTVGCDGSSCTSAVSTGNALLSALVFDQPSFVALRVLQSVGTAGVLALVVFLIVYKIGFSSKWGSMDTVNLVAFLLCLFTILVLLASAAVFVAYYWPFFTYVNIVDKTSLPWSPMMSFLATLILMVVCVFIRINCRPEIFRGAAIPMSGDSKFELHPQVQNGLSNRYYNQTPYIEDRYAVDDHRSLQTRTRTYEEYDDRRNGAPNNYEPPRGSYINRIFTDTEPPTTTGVFYTKPASREFRENRDREIGHTIYTANGFSYLKGEVSRPDRDEIRYGRPVALVEYNSSRIQGDDYNDQFRSSSRALQSSSRAFPQSSSMYIYRPHQY